MAQTNNRQAQRAPVTLKIKFKSETLEQFIERYSVDVSHGGIFIRTREPLAVGTTLKFEFQLKDATPLIAGEGTVVWTREHDPARAGVAPGMGVRFDNLPQSSQSVLDRVLAKKTGKASTPAAKAVVDDDAADDFVDTPTRVAPADLVDNLARKVSDYEESSDRTPLPRPMPFHSDAGDFPEETFEEATRVASLDKLIAATEDQDDEQGEDAAPSSRADTEIEDRAREIPRRRTDTDADARQDTELDVEATAARVADRPLSDAPTRPAASQRSLDTQTDEPETTSANDRDDSKDEVAAARSRAAAEEFRGAAPPPAEEEERGSSLPWIAVAAVVLLLGGVGGFILLNKDAENDAKIADLRADGPPPTATGAPSTPTPAVSETAAEPAQPTPVAPEVQKVDVVVTSSTSGAIASVVGTDLSAPTPATFQLEEGKTFTVVVSCDEHLSQSLEVVAGGKAPKAVKLAPMKKILRIASTPRGAQVFVNGRRIKGLTPLDVPVDNKLAARPEASITLRLAGHSPLTQQLALAQGFTAEGDSLVLSFAATMTKPVAALPRPKPVTTNAVSKVGDDNATADKDPGTTNDSAADGASSGASDAEPTDLDNAPASDGAKTPPPSTEPKPDAPEPKPDAPEPKPETGDSPTPDWMK